MWIQPILVVLGVYYVTIGTIATTVALYEEHRSDQNYRGAMVFGVMMPLIPLIGMDRMVGAYEAIK